MIRNAPEGDIDATSDLNEFDNKLFVVAKESGPTSFDIVKALRSAVRVKKAGHAGTLDPLAEGVLLVMTGRATRAARYFMELNKIYRFDVELGVGTETLDREGAVVERVPCPAFSPGTIAAAAGRLTGTCEQKPPLYSAVKQNGTRLYKLAREGKAPEVKKRKVTIYRFDILDIELPVVRCEIECSRGTYVRSVARDFGALLSVPAHVAWLARDAVGPFSRDTAVPSARIFEGSIGADDGIPLERALGFLPAVTLGEVPARALLNGIPPKTGDVTERAGSCEPGRPVRLLDETGALLAVGDASADGAATIVDSYTLFVNAA